MAIATRKALRGGICGFIENQLDWLKPSQNSCDFCYHSSGPDQRRHERPSVRFVCELLKDSVIEVEGVPRLLRERVGSLQKSLDLLRTLLPDQGVRLFGGHPQPRFWARFYTSQNFFTEPKGFFSRRAFPIPLLIEGRFCGGDLEAETKA